MNPFGELSDQNGEQVKKYLKFFRQKREGFVRAVSSEIQECKADRVTEDMFSREDVEDIVDFLNSSIRGHITQDLSTLINMGALTISQLLVDAQEKGVELNLDTSMVENQSLLEAVEKMSLDAMPKNPRRGVGELVSFKEEARAKQLETERLENANRRLSDEVSMLRQRLESAERTERIVSASAAKELSDYDAANSGRIRSLESDLAEAKDEVNRKVSETTQFQQMRKMMQSQANTIKDLRRRLQKYEPDVCKEDDP